MTVSCPVKEVEIDPSHVKGTTHRECFGCVGVYLVCNCVWVGGACNVHPYVRAQCYFTLVLEAYWCVVFLASCSGVQNSTNKISHLLTLWYFKSL